MTHWTVQQWLLVGLLAALYLMTCFRVAFAMGRIGRSRVKWFFLTLLLTAIPAMIVMWRYRVAAMTPARRVDAPRDSAPRGRASREAGGATTCPHCQELIHPEELSSSAGPCVCPRCRLPVGEDATA